jgi:hypothetical protein
MKSVHKGADEHERDDADVNRATNETRKIVRKGRCRRRTGVGLESR